MYFTKQIKESKFIPEYLMVSYIRLFGSDCFSNKKFLIEQYRNLRRDSGAYVGRVLLDALYGLANREDVLEIRKSFSRSNLWEKRQIIRLIDSTFDEEEKRPWLKNIRQIESNELFLLETAEPIKLTKKKKEGKQKKAAVPNQPGGGRKNVPQTQVSYGGHAGRPDVLADAVNAMQRDLSARQQELKQRLQQKYGTAASNTAKPTQAARPVSNPGKDTILNRADSNVNENQTDELREQFYEKTGEPPKKVHGECEDECSLMDQVNDLMIMGYQANLSFERDFVAEGVEMLNRLNCRTKLRD